jgi:hypothetical protein
MDIPQAVIDAGVDAMLDCEHNGLKCYDPHPLGPTVFAVLQATLPAMLAAERERIVLAVAALPELKLRDYPGSGPHVSKSAVARIALGES